MFLSILYNFTHKHELLSQTQKKTRFSSKPHRVYLRTIKPTLKHSHIFLLKMEINQCTPSNKNSNFLCYFFHGKTSFSLIISQLWWFLYGKWYTSSTHVYGNPKEEKKKARTTFTRNTYCWAQFPFHSLYKLYVLFQWKRLLSLFSHPSSCFLALSQPVSRWLLRRQEPRQLSFPKTSSALAIWPV